MLVVSVKVVSPLIIGEVSVLAPGQVRERGPRRCRGYVIVRIGFIIGVGSLDRVEVLDRSGRRESIGEMNDFWYRVRSEEGLEGWSYGYFIDLP